MFRLFTIIFLALFISTTSKGDSIYDLDIEGIKLGESVFKYMSKEQIVADRKKHNTFYSSDRYKRVKYFKKYGYSGNLYDALQFHYDKNGKLGNISGNLIMEGKTNNQCIGRSLSIIDDISIKVNSQIKGNPKKIIKFKGTKYTSSYFKFNDGLISLQCHFPSTIEKLQHPVLQVNLNSRDFNNWMNNEAYK